MFQVISLDLITAVLGGALTGYMTNSLALNMIFKKYGPFGGVIVRTKNEFIKNISKLVERDIINHNTLEKELHSQKFEQALREFTADFIDRILTNDNINIQLGDIPGLSRTLSNISNMSSNYSYTDKKASDIDYNGLSYCEVIFYNLCKVPLNKKILKTIISQNQLENIVDNLTDSITMSAVENTNIIADMIKEFYEEISEKRILDIVPPELTSKLINNLEKGLDDIDLQLEQRLDKSINYTFDNIYKIMKLSDTLKEIEESLKNKSLIKLLGEDNIERIELEFEKYFKSNNSKEMVDNITRKLFAILKDIELKVFDVFNDDVKVFFTELLQDETSALIEQYVKSIQNNKEELELHIDNSITRVLKNSSGLKNEIKKILFKNEKKHILINNLIDKFINGDINKLSRKITDMLIQYLKEHSIGEIITILADNKFLTAESISKVIYKYIDLILDKTDIKNSNLLQKKLGDFIELNTGKTLKYYIKKEVIYTTEIIKIIKDFIKTETKRLTSKKINKVIADDIIFENNNIWAEQAVELFNQNNLKVQKNLLIRANNYLNKFDREQVDQSRIYNIISNYLNNSFNHLKKKKIKKFKKLYDNKAKLSGSISQKLLNVLINNLPQLLKGHIESAVSKNLYKLKDEKIQTVVEKFMGTELKPITTLGAVLGGAAGIGLVYLQGLYNWLPSATGLYTSVFVYGAVGWFTNILALKMIFRPYQPKKIFGYQLPFTPGVVAKNKNRFASSVAEFVNNELLTPKIANKVFQDNVEQIKAKIKSSVTEDNYKVLNNIITDNKQQIFQGFSKYLYNNIEQQREKISDYLTEILKDVDLKNYNFDTVNRSVYKNLYNLLLSTDKILRNGLDNHIEFDDNEESPLKLEDIFPEQFKGILVKNTNKKIKKSVDKLCSQLEKKENIKQLLELLEDGYNKLTEKKVNEIVSEDNLDKIKNKLVKLILSKNSADKLISLLDKPGCLWNKIFANNPLENSKHNIFHSKIIQYSEENKDFLVSLLIKQTIQLTNNNKEIVKNRVEESINSYYKKQIQGKSMLEKIKIGLTVTGYEILGVEETFNKIIDDFIKNELPLFLNNNRNDIELLLNTILSELEQQDLHKYQFNINKDNISKYINKGITGKKWDSTIGEIIEDILPEFSEHELKSYLSLLDIEDIYDFNNIFTEEIDIFIGNFTYALKDNKKDISIEINNLVEKFIKQMLLTIPVSQLIKDLPRNEINTTIENIYSLLEESRAVENNLKKIVDSIIFDMQGKGIEELLDLEQLKMDINHTLNLIIKDDEIKQEFNESIIFLAEFFLDNIIDLLDTETKEFIVNITLESFTDVLSTHFYNLMKEIDIKRITQEEMDKMSPEEIEKLFNSLAGHYFSRLKAYGWMGSIIGLIMELVNMLIR